MEILSIEQVRKYIPHCTEIRMCPKIVDCIKDNKRLCAESDQPCYITFKKDEFKKDELEGVITIDFKNNMITVNRLNEDYDYARIIMPDGVDIELKGKESKEKLKKIMKSMRKEQQ